MDTSIKIIKTTALLKEGLDKMKKWSPFATMPEQYIGLKEIINKQEEVAQPFNRRANGTGEFHLN